MKTINITASDPQKPATPAPAPQQTQGDAPKPTEKPAEQQK